MRSVTVVLYVFLDLPYMTAWMYFLGTLHRTKIVAALVLSPDTHINPDYRQY